MNQVLKRSIAIWTIGCLFAWSTGLASAADHVRSPAEVFADDLIALSQLVLDHHFQPPTKQQFVLAAARGLFEAKELEIPRDLAARCSRAGADADLKAILIEASGADYGADSKRDAERRNAVTLTLSSLVAGGLSLSTPKAHRANRQLSENRYVGVGVAVRMDENDDFTITTVLPGSPMHKAGYPDGSRIIEIDGWKTNNQRLEECVERLRGPEGSSVRMVMRRPGGTSDEPLTIYRGIVPQKTLNSEISQEGARTILVLRPIQISGSLPHEIREVAAAHPRLDGVVLDLRGTQAGSAHFAVLLADLFLGDGMIGFIRHGDRRRAVQAEDEELFANIPIAVVVGSETTGSCEWLAAVLVENGRVRPFGEATEGLAVDKESFELPSGELVANFATTVMETPKGEKLLSSVSLGHSLRAVRRKDSKDKAERPVIAGRLIPPVAQAPPAAASFWAALFRPPMSVQPLQGTVALTTRLPQGDPLVAAVQYLANLPVVPSDKGAE